MAIFGNQNEEASEDFINTDDLHGSWFTSGADAAGATVDNIKAYCYEDRAGILNAKAVIVKKGDLNIITNGVSNPSQIGFASAWVTFTFPTTPTLEASTDYVLMLIPDSGFYNFLIHYTAGDAGSYYEDTSNNYTTPTNPTDAGTDNYVWSIYCTYTEAAVGGTNSQINIADTWKEVAAMKINIGDSWKEVASAQINIGDVWKSIY